MLQLSSPDCYTCSTVVFRTTLWETTLHLHLLSLITKTCSKSELVLQSTIILRLSCHNWLTQLAFWPNSNGVPGTQTSSTQTCSLLGATPWQQAHTARATVGETPRWQRTHMRAPAAMAAAKEAPCRNDNRNGIREARLLLWGRRRCKGQIGWREWQQTTPNAVTSKGKTKDGGQGTRQSCGQMGVEALGKMTTN